MTTETNPSARAARVVAYVGSYSSETSPGGIHVFDATEPAAWTAEGHVAEPAEAGYLAWSPTHQALYAVDERKTDGRGPVGPPAAVHALAVDPATGNLTSLGSRAALGAYPTYLAVDSTRDLLIAVSHGSFEHIERIVPDPSGGWTVEFIYDDSTVVVYDIADRTVGEVRDVQVLSGHGLDPNSSPQANGHGQASAHAHCAVIDPSGRRLVVCDKATDRVYVFALGPELSLLHTLQLDSETGPRHAVFTPDGATLYVTLEFSSELATLSVDPDTGALSLHHRCTTTAPSYNGPNEPADLRHDPTSATIYVNNRGEDTLAWFTPDSSGAPVRGGDVGLAASDHPGLAARSFALHPTAPVLAVADRPADLVRLYHRDDDGSLTFTGEVAVPSPAYVTFAQLEVST